jgi:branched-chain amino acid transport system substrate-binding protein
VEQINAAGGVLGRPLQIITADNGCTPDGAVSAARKLIDLDQVDVILGGGCSGATLGAMPVIQQAQIVQLTDVSSNPTITANAGPAGGNIWQFRINADDSIIAKTFSNDIAKEAKSVVVYASNNDFGRGAVDAYNLSLPKAGVEVKGVEFYQPGQADYRSGLAKVQTQNPDALLMIMESQDAAIFVRQLDEVGFKPKLFARGSVVTPEFVELIKDQPSLGEGLREASLWAVGEDPAFDSAFQLRYGKLPPANGSGPYYAAKVLAEAIRIAGKADRTSIREGLTKVDMQLPWGHVKFDDHNQAHPNITVSVIKDGKIQLLSVLPTE